MFEILGYLENRTLGFVINIFRLRTIHWKFWPPVYTTALTLLAATCIMYFTSIATFFYTLAQPLIHFLTLFIYQCIKVYILCTEKALQVMYLIVFENQALIYSYIFLQVCLFLWIDLKTLNQVYTRLKFLKLGK